MYTVIYTYKLYSKYTPLSLLLLSYGQIYSIAIIRVQVCICMWYVGPWVFPGSNPLQYF